MKVSSLSWLNCNAYHRQHLNSLKVSIIWRQAARHQNFLSISFVGREEVAFCTKYEMNDFPFERPFLTFSFIQSQIRCTSQIHGVYSQKTEKTIDQERPKSTHTSSNSINLRHNNIPSDQYYYQDGDVPGKKDSLSVHVKGEYCRHLYYLLPCLVCLFGFFLCHPLLPPSPQDPAPSTNQQYFFLFFEDKSHRH